MLRKSISIFLVLITVLALTITTATAQDAETGWCSDVDIVFFPGGPPGGPFASVVFNGAVQAAADLGANVEYIWSDWNPELMITGFAEAIATNPDGIAVMGHPGTEAYAPLVEEAEAAGIVVTSQNVTLDELEARFWLEWFRLCWSRKLLGWL